MIVKNIYMLDIINYRIIKVLSTLVAVKGYQFNLIEAYVIRSLNIHQ